MSLPGRTAQAKWGPPHDASHGITCMDCHTLHGAGELLPRGTAQEALCKSCHNPTGQAPGMVNVANHVVDGETKIVDCGSCHDPHGAQTTTDPHASGATAVNLRLVRGNTSKYVSGAVEPAIFQKKPDHFVFGEQSAPWNGICQTCHSATNHHRNSTGSDHAHMIGNHCTSCHGHKDGFAASGGCTECHAVAQNGRRQIVGAGGDFSKAHVHGSATPIDNDCTACHYVGSHMSGTVKLKDPDLGSAKVYTYNPSDTAALSAFCAGCHDADGATSLATPLQPFSSGQTPVDIAATGLWASSAHATRSYAGNNNKPVGCLGNGTSSGCHGNGHASEDIKLLAQSASKTIDDLCSNCHSGGSHVSGKTFVISGRTYTLRCTSCHNPHVVSGKSSEVGAGLSPVTRPATGADPQLNPRAMGAAPWGDGAGEKIQDYAGTGKYRTPKGDTLGGDQLPDYATLCLDCHGPMSGSFGGIDWNSDPHGKQSANSPNGGGTCPDWYGCGKATGWDGDDCVGTEAECWPVITRGRGDQIFSRGPYDHTERIAGANFVLSCGDCHQSHGAGIGSKLRASVNGGPGSVTWNTMCNNCHYYYSDWHAGMSCGNASCHVSNSIHRMNAKTGSGATRTFNPELVFHYGFNGNLNDGGDWRLHGRWFDQGASYTTGKSGNAVVFDGDDPVEVGSRNAWWSTDEGRHGTWKYSELKYNGSMEAWVYPTEGSKAEYIIAAKHTYTDGGYAFLLQPIDGELRASLLISADGGGTAGVWDADCNGLRGAFSAKGVPLNTWTHVAATFDTALPDRDPGDLSVGRIRIYVNGEDVTTSGPWYNGQCYAQPGAGEDIIYAYSLHSPANEAICYNGMWCASALSLGGVMWGSGSRKGLVGRLDEFKLWNITKAASYFDALVPPAIVQATAVAGSAEIQVSFSEGVWTGSGKVGALTAADFALVDVGGDNPRSITSVAHTAGADTAVLTTSAVQQGADLGSDKVAAASSSAIWDDQGNAMATTAAVIEAQPAAACPTLPVKFELNEAAGALKAGDEQGVMMGDVVGSGSFTGDGLFHGDGAANHIDFTANQTCLKAQTKLTLEARFKPSVVDSGADSTIQRVFVKNGNNYQMSLWRNTTAAWSPPFSPPAGVCSVAFWVRVADNHGGQNWKPALSDYTLCPVVAGHWYHARVVWDASKPSGPPYDLYIEDQGTDGAGTGQAWSGLANCTDTDQSQKPVDRRFFVGDQILGGDGTHALGATEANTLFFNGTIDWVRVTQAQ